VKGSGERLALGKQGKEWKKKLAEGKERKREIQVQVSLPYK
jgi:hypothetical protein